MTTSPRRVTARPSPSHVLASPIGRLRLTASEQGLSRVEMLDRMPPDGRRCIEAEPDGTAPRDPILRQAVAALQRYFAGRGLPGGVPLDRGACTDFQWRVLTVLAREVPHGAVVSYGELARLAGRPGAARAVGTTMARNPLPIFLPCHRVVAGHGIGGFGGGLDCKRFLLAHEGAVVTAFA